MSLKNWVLGKVHGDARPGESDGRRAPSLQGSIVGDEGGDRGGTHEDRGSDQESAHLGPYAPLITAIRAELEHFAESQLRLHLAIAERDRYVLTSIEIDCEPHDEHDVLLRRFVREFKPEQIKRFLARDVIAGLRNASAIDLAQFAGLGLPRDTPPDKDDPYGDLIADLKKDPSGATANGFDVTLVGRWVQGDVQLAEGGQRGTHRGTTDADRAQTPLAGRGLIIDIEDAQGARRVELKSIVPGRRYAAGKDEQCEIRVDGDYASRRHCEIWFDRDAWWVVDTGSTNGIRVEAEGSIAHGNGGTENRPEPIRVPAGAVIVLSAFARGEPRLYPRSTLSPVPQSGGQGERDGAAVRTPLAPARPRKGALTLTASMASGIREIDLTGCSLPFGIGRSRKQALSIDSSYSDVSGKHLEIVAIEDMGAWVVVHGDNGVTVNERKHAAGEKFLWQRGETILLGHADSAAADCTLTLSLAEPTT